jgi:hypothetical protein
MAPCQSVQRAYDGRAVEVFRSIVEAIGKGVMESAHCFIGVAGAPFGKANSLPIVDEHSQREAISSAASALGFRGLFALGGWVLAAGNVAHDRSSGVARRRAQALRMIRAGPAISGRATRIGKGRSGHLRPSPALRGHAGRRQTPGGPCCRFRRSVRRFSARSASWIPTCARSGVRNGSADLQRTL